MAEKQKGEGVMSEKIKTVVFSIVVTAIFTLLVSGVNFSLKTKIDNNRLVARQKVILNLFGLFNPQNPISDNEIISIFQQKIAPVTFTQNPKLQCFKLKEGNDNLFVIAFIGQGFWDNINGYMAMDTGRKVIDALAFTQHGETPGLGGRISEPEFMARFKNKHYEKVRSDGLRLKIVAEGSAAKPDEIDGITGATGTSNAVEKIINSSISTFLSLQQGGISQ